MAVEAPFASAVAPACLPLCCCWHLLKRLVAACNLYQEQPFQRSELVAEGVVACLAQCMQACLHSCDSGALVSWQRRLLQHLGMQTCLACSCRSSGCLLVLKCCMVWRIMRCSSHGERAASRKDQIHAMPDTSLHLRCSVRASFCTA